MSRTAKWRPVAFYHQDGLVPAWNFAKRYAGRSGHVATLPELIELRLGTEPGTEDSPWENWYTSSSAEYVGVGADGRVKIIVAHGVGPMATIDGIKAAYKWQYGDKTRSRRGGRITAQQFLDLEAGKYGSVKSVNIFRSMRHSADDLRPDVVNVLDFQDYLDFQQMFQAFRLASGGRAHPYLSAPRANYDPLLRFRLGPKGDAYLLKHEELAKAFHKEEHPNAGIKWAREFDDSPFPFITEVDWASNCPVTQVKNSKRPYDEWEWEPRVPEEGYAFAHLLSLDRLTHTHTSEVGVVLLSSPGIHEWSNGAKFVSVPRRASLGRGVIKSPDASQLLRERWEHFMEPVSSDYEPVRPFLLRSFKGEWFAVYPKKFPDQQCMDSGDLEFRCQSVELVGRKDTFTTDDDFFLRYSLQEIRSIIPDGANAYEITNVSGKDSLGLTTVTVRFYRADVDLTRHLPKVDVLARDYGRLMEGFAQ